MSTTTSSAFTVADPNAIRRQLQAVLLSSEDIEIRKNWAKALEIGTANRLLDTFVRAVELSQYAIDRSTEERHIDTALLESSIRAVLRDLDVRTMRKIPAGVNVYVSRDSSNTVSKTIPAFSVWTGGGKTLYNRYPIKFETGQRVIPARLYVGELKTVNFGSTGLDFQEWLSPEGDFTVSDGREIYKGVEYTDIIVKVSGTPIAVSDSKQWWDMYSSSTKAVKDRTTIDGRCQLIFGDSSYGYLPPANTVVTVQYAVTKGSEDNSGNFTSDITLSNDATVTAFPVAQSSSNNIATSRIDGGSNEVPYSTYRKTGPLLYASAGTAIRANSAQAWATNYPGIADALVLGQSKTNPNDRRYMNVLSVCLLKGGDGIDPEDYILSSAEADGWLQHFNSRRPSVNGHIIMYRPMPSSPDIRLVLECQSYVNLALAEVAATEAITDLFKYRAGTLRGTLLLSEIFDTAKYATEGIRGVRSPTLRNDLVTYARPPTISLSAEVASNNPIQAGEYVFYVLSRCNVYDGGNIQSELSVPSNALVYSAQGTNNPTMSFNQIVGAEAYDVYCRRPGTSDYIRVAQLDSRTHEFTMTRDANLEPGVIMPLTQPLTFRFPKLGNLLIEATYSTNEW